MKVTAFNGSMRGKRSITTIMVREFLAGAQQAGAETEHVLLVKKKIRHCRGCLTCWIKTPGQCIHKDDMAPLLETYMASDFVVIASPVYVENVTGLTKDFIDRLIPLCDPHFEPDENGETRHVKRYDTYPGIVAMSNSGFVEQSAFSVLRLFFTRTARSMNAKLVAHIYKGGGGLLGLDEPALAPMIDQYKSLLRKAGEEIVTRGQLLEQTREALEEQVVPTDVYNGQVNALWDMLISKVGDKGQDGQ